MSDTPHTDADEIDADVWLQQRSLIAKLTTATLERDEARKQLEDALLVIKGLKQ